VSAAPVADDEPESPPAAEVVRVTRDAAAVHAEDAKALREPDAVRAAREAGDDVPAGDEHDPAVVNADQMHDETAVSVPDAQLRRAGRGGRREADGRCGRGDRQRE
jgi:hypothetical protein